MSYFILVASILAISINLSTVCISQHPFMFALCAVMWGVVAGVHVARIFNGSKP